MKTLPTVFFLVVVLISGPFVTAKEAVAESVDTLELGLHAGYRVDQFGWNTAGYNQSAQYVNILSELDWEDIEIWQLGAFGKLALGNETAPFLTYIRGSIDYGWIDDGTVRDSDYNGDNRPSGWVAQPLEVVSEELTLR